MPGWAGANLPQPSLLYYCWRVLGTRGPHVFLLVGFAIRPKAPRSWSMRSQSQFQAVSCFVSQVLIFTSGFSPYSCRGFWCANKQLKQASQALHAKLQSNNQNVFARYSFEQLRKHWAKCCKHCRFVHWQSRLTLNCLANTQGKYLIRLRESHYTDTSWTNMSESCLPSRHFKWQWFYLFYLQNL